MNIRKSTVFVGPNGERVEQITLCDNISGQFLTEQDRIDRKIDEPLNEFLAVISMLNDFINSQGEVSVVPIEVRFKMDVKTLEESFEKFYSEVDKFQEIINKGYNESKKKKEEIILPNSLETMAINSQRIKT